MRGFLQCPSLLSPFFPLLAAAVYSDDDVLSMRLSSRGS